jgi:hypothetical protein
MFICVADRNGSLFSDLSPILYICKNRFVTGLRFVSVILVGLFMLTAPVASSALMGSSNMQHSGGLTATLSGLAFASLDLTPTATVGEVNCATSAWVSGTTVQCMASASSSGDSIITVTVASVSGTGKAVFTFDAPVASRALVGDSNIPASGGLSMTLSGLSFAGTDLTPTGSVADIDCATSSWASATSVQCLAASATATSVTKTTVTVASVSGTLNSFFTFDGAVSFEQRLQQQVIFVLFRMPSYMLLVTCHHSPLY